MRSAKQAGFTLIELLVVVLVIGVLAALAVPRFSLVALRAEQAEAPAILKQICTLAEAEGHRVRGWPAPAGSDGLDAVPGWSDPNADSFQFSYALADGVGSAIATPRTTANSRLTEMRMNCDTKAIR